MGLVSGLLLFPITGPIWGLRLIVEGLRDEAEAALRDEGRAFAELIDLSMRHKAGQLSDAEFAAQDAELLERLSSLREYRDELLHPESEVDEDEDEGENRSLDAEAGEDDHEEGW